MKIITLKETAICADCGKNLPAGSRARYYGKDKIYCETHDKPAAVAAASTKGQPVPQPSPGELPAREAAARSATAARLPVTRAELVHLLEGIKFIIDSMLAQLKEE